MAPSREAPDNAVQVPSTSTFSFKAPFPASSSNFAIPSPIKQRRVSLALPSSPRVVEGWNFRDDTGLDAHVPETEDMTPAKRGKMRKLTNGADSDPYQEKKQRKKWSDEETQMLVTGCNRHGVGNWKTILSDPTLHFDNRSPVDLKDRFRTYFPDAYKEHYPNARTHLSSKVRSTLPDGSSLFEKTRSKKRRPFTEEEDRALKAGYEKHGTVWATIVKDPVFREQGRRSTDLRDRFRNAFPELYQAAGYKPRNASKKRLLGDDQVVRAATDDQLSMSSTGPVRSRRRAHTSQGLFRGGTKSVPQSTACSEDEDSSAGEEDCDSVFKTPHTPIFVDNVSTSSSRSKKFVPFSQESIATADDDDMDMVTFDQLSSDPLNIPDFMPTSQHHSQYPNHEMDGPSQTWSGVNTPTHSHHAWSTAAGSPTSSHLSAEYLMSGSSSHAHSPALQRGMIGKSAWGTQDWFSANPRLDPGHSNTPSSTSYPADGPLSPASPFSFSNLNHGVLDRYDLLPTLMPHDFSSEVGVGDSHSTFSDEMFPPSGFRGFTHHSNYAGDLIFGARTHQPQHSHHSNYLGYASGAGGTTGFGAFGTPGLGLSGITHQTGIHPMQLALPGIDEIELTGITLDDTTQEDTGMAQDDPAPRAGGLKTDGHPEQVQVGKDDGQEKFSLDDLVDLSAHDQDDDVEPHATPPGTPHIQRARGIAAGVRRASESTFGGYHGATNARSISVPPSEVRNQLPQTPAPPPLPLLTTSPRQLGTASRPGIYYGQQEPSPSSAGTSQRSGGDKSVLSSPMPPPPPPSAPAYLLSPAPDEYAWRSMASEEMNNLNLSFLDLHYYAGGADGGGVDIGNTEVQVQVRQGQALDLAQASVGGLRALPTGLRHNITSAGSRNGGRSGGVIRSVGATRGAGGGTGRVGKGISGAAAASGVGSGRSQSHHRGQSAVCPQDLVLRNDNKRKRASWDGAQG